MRVLFETDWGRMAAEDDGLAITALFLPGCIPDGFESDGEPSLLMRRMEEEVGEFFAGNRRQFTLPLRAEGTAFQRAVWDALLRIPYGELATYGDVAKELGKPGASRAVGMACGRNPVPLLIPCHRVVGTGNRLTGFSGGGVAVKQRLIALETGGLFARR